MLKSRKYLLALTLIFGASLIATSNVLAKNSINIHRLAGQDRYGTSSAIVTEGWTQSNYAVLVNGENFPDAIVSSPLAKKYNAPILLTASNTLTDSTKQKLQNLGVKNVFIIGGTGVISGDIENTLQGMGISVKRICGQDRYETSVDVAKELGISKGVFVVSGEHYQDALSVAPIADKLQYPIILISQDSVTNTVKEYINDIKNNGGEVDVVALKPLNRFGQLHLYLL
ncbi:cell wall-binding repeat-containing protein [Clostridium sp. WILCCON 0269]|uniref:Cell wall-binding repeat-containing protein n=1 Tax=Candidatus Clostridium eludens TaxID=3381663 RepID=A0ABW8SG21_9CLOT